jgi:hypothetical protein
MEHPNHFDRQIRLRAYQFWEERGMPWGTPETDWCRAEQELNKPEGGLSRLAREVGSAIGAVVALVNDAERI